MIELREIKSLPELMAWRQEVICHVFGEEPSADLIAQNRKYYQQHIADGSHYALVASVDGEDCGCGALCMTDELPSPDNTSGHCAYLMNIYVREAFRKHGIAHIIVKALVAEAKLRDCGKIYLEATSDGKPVYASLGFEDMPDMMKYYDTEI